MDILYSLKANFTGNAQDIISWNEFEKYKNNYHLPRAQYRKISNIKRTLVGNNIVDHSDVVGA